MRPMPIAADRLQHLLESAFPGASVSLERLVDDDDHYRATLAAPQFAGKSRIEQHRMVMDALARAGCDIHALSLSTRAA